MMHTFHNFTIMITQIEKLCCKSCRFFDTFKAPGSWPPMVTCPANANPCDYDGLVQIEVAKMQASVNLTFAGSVAKSG